MTNLVTIFRDPSRDLDIVYLDDVPYVDTIPGGLEFGVDRDILRALRDCINTYLKEPRD